MHCRIYIRCLQSFLVTAGGALPQITALFFSPSDYTVEEQPSEMVLIQELESGRAKPVVFVLNANLLAMIKLVNCMSPLLVCWVR